ncbi:hypothetical protein SAMN04487964_10312 [Marinobacterium sediminicola]|uniref:Uncharacterized protein n=1 Tax=Marinobacterium sediminicola TaxID=518898 RepID=A0ABY1RXQ0_9GAMM|nr:hypothetical protein SAMN04487964_10312 [Marinobacterium sediminicola]
MNSPLKIYLWCLPLLLVINQAFYGFCFKAHCIGAALPSVVIMSGVLTAVIYFSDTRNSGSDYIGSSEDDEGKPR